MDDRSVIFIYMDHLHTFRKFILAESEKGLPLKKLKENDMKEYSETDKQILDFMADNTELIEEGSDIDEIDGPLVNEAYFTLDDVAGKKFLKDAGGIDALAYIIEQDEMFFGEVDQGTVQLMKERRYDGLANLYVFYRGKELLEDSEVLKQKIAADDDEMDQADIEQLEEELRFLSS